MDLAGVKLVVTDMDGTLLNSNHEVSDLFFEQFEQLKAKNIYFVAASGRQYHSILDKLQRINEHIIIVAENGAYIMKNGTELFVNAISTQDIKKLIPMFTSIKGVHIVLCGKKKAYILDGPSQFKNTISEYYTEYTVLDNFNTIPDDDYFKIALCHYDGSEVNIYPYVKQLENDWQVKISGELWVDISLKTTHKGNAIQQIQSLLGITNDQTMAFGDYFNDIEMLESVKFSYAMQNAHPEIKKIAAYETLSNNDNGVEHVLDTLLRSN